jgi:hypothetical protein
MRESSIILALVYLSPKAIGTFADKLARQVILTDLATGYIDGPCALFIADVRSTPPNLHQ